MTVARFRHPETPNGILEYCTAKGFSDHGSLPLCGAYFLTKSGIQSVIVPINPYYYPTIVSRFRTLIVRKVRVTYACRQVRCTDTFFIEVRL